MIGADIDLINAVPLDDIRDQFAEIRADAVLSLNEDDLGLTTLVDWASLPEFRTDEYQQFSSHNRWPPLPLFELGGDFNNFESLAGIGLPLLVHECGNLDGGVQVPARYVLASVEGRSGYVSRMYFSRTNILGRLPEVLRVFVDDLEQTAIVIPLADLGGANPFVPPFAGLTSGAILSYLPISFQDSLRIEIEQLCAGIDYFYQIDVKSTDSSTRRFSARLDDDPVYVQAAELLEGIGEPPDAEFDVVVDPQTIEVNAASRTEIYSDQSFGTVKRLGFRIDESALGVLSQIRLEISYDGASVPAIQAGMDGFFGLRNGYGPFQTLPMQVRREGTGIQLDCYLPMPFASGLQLSLVNQGEAPIRIEVKIALDRELPTEPWGYLHARLFEAVGPQLPGSLFEVVGLEGRGRYIGTFLYTSGGLDILEGNETAVIDGAIRIHGTGMEDYCNGGYYFAAGPFDHPFATANVKAARHTPNGRLRIISCCRWHILTDAIDFQETFQLRFQYGRNNPLSVGSVATVAYYYIDRPEPGDVSGGNLVLGVATGPSSSN